MSSATFIGDPAYNGLSALSTKNESSNSSSSDSLEYSLELVSPNSESISKWIFSSALENPSPPVQLPAISDSGKAEKGNYEYKIENICIEVRFVLIFWLIYFIYLLIYIFFMRIYIATTDLFHF